MKATKLSKQRFARKYWRYFHGRDGTVNCRLWGVSAVACAYETRDTKLISLAKEYWGSLRDCPESEYCGRAETRLRAALEWFWREWIRPVRECETFGEWEERVEYELGLLEWE